MNRFTLNAFCLCQLFTKEVQAAGSETTFFQGSLWENPFEKQEWESGYSCHPHALPLPLQLSSPPNKDHFPCTRVMFTNKTSIRKYSKYIFFSYYPMQFITFGYKPCYCSIFCLIFQSCELLVLHLLIFNQVAAFL